VFDRRFTPYLFIAPFFLLFAVFGVFPTLYTSWVSLHDWQLINGDQGFVGLANYAEVLADPKFYNALGNTVSIFLIGAIPQTAIALGIAMLLDRPLRMATAWRAGIVLPNVVSVAAVALVFAQLYGRDYGVVNWGLAQAGLDRVSWQADTWSSHVAIASMVAWRWTGYNALIYLAAMQAVPGELYEAAAMDGASRWRAFWSVTLPGIRPTMLFTVLASTINGLQLFAEPQLFGGSSTGGNSRQFQTVTMYLYEKGFGSLDAGYAAAISWVMSMICVLFALGNVCVARRLIRKA
jgi:cellobiose transport system permease protein